MEIDEIEKILQMDPVFEIPVIEIETSNTCYITCTPYFNYDTHVLTVQREDVSTEEENDHEFISSNSIVLDLDLSLDENLQNLYGEIIDSIINGDLHAIL